MSENKNGCVSGEPAETQAESSASAVTVQFSELDEEAKGIPLVCSAAGTNVGIGVWTNRDRPPVMQLFR
jgi:hypothetical protein